MEVFITGSVGEARRGVARGDDDWADVPMSGWALFGGVDVESCRDLRW